MIDQATPEGKALQARVKLELRNYLGKDYNDDVLPLYIVVMLAHGNQQPLVAENLEAFLGQEKAVNFAQWLFTYLASHPGKYDSSQTVPSEARHEAGQGAPEEIMEQEPGTHKRSRENRDKIEWKGESEEISKSHRDREDLDRERDLRREKRRKSDQEERLNRQKEREAWERERARERERDRSAQDRWDSDKHRYDSQRDKRRGHERERYSERIDRPRQSDYSRSDDNGRHNDHFDDRRASNREEKKGKEVRHADRGRGADAEDREVPLRLGNRLAGRLGGVARSKSPSPPLKRADDAKEEARPSIFDRIKAVPRAAKPLRGPQSERESKMRMDNAAIPAEAKALAEAPPSPQPIQSHPSMGAPEEVALELRQIRETLAKMQAEKMQRVVSVAASQNARRAVVHNVHFNATPDILKAHFGACGAVVSAIMDRDTVGNPTGIATVEFEEESGRKRALTLSGSMMLGRPITVFAKESAPAYSPPGQTSRPQFRTRAPAPGRGAPGRGPLLARGPHAARSSFPGRLTLKNNKYVRPQPAANTNTAAS